MAINHANTYHLQVELRFLAQARRQLVEHVARNIDPVGVARDARDADALADDRVHALARELFGGSHHALQALLF